MISYVGRTSPKIPILTDGALYWDYINGNLYGSRPNSGEWTRIGGYEDSQGYSYFLSTGDQRPVVSVIVAYEPCVLTPNNVNCRLFYLAGACTINLCKAYVNTGVAGATANFGIYDEKGNLLYDSGSLSVSSSGSVVTSTNISANILLQPGWYYFGMSCSSTSVLFMAYNQNNVPQYYSLFGGTPRNVLASTSASGGALPKSMGVIATLPPADNVYQPVVLFTGI
jgi:hypothetical protein